MSRKTEATLIVLILLLAAWLRFRGLDWGLPHAYHPDEGSVLFHSLAFGTGDLNPHWFRWPSFMMYFMFGVYGVYYAVGRLVGTFGAPVDILKGYLTDLSPFWLMGRWVSALAGVATVWVTYRIGKRAFGVAAGLIGALFLAVLYLHVRDSHYATPDVVTTLLASLSLLAAVRACESERVRDLVLSGLLAGFAASAKYPGVLASVGTLAAFAHLRSRRAVPFSSIIGAAAACLLGFVIGTPYSVLSWPEFARDVSRQFTMVGSSGVAQISSSFAAGLGEVFGRTVMRGIGLPISMLAAVGIVAVSGGRTGKRRGGLLMLAAYAIAVFVFAVLITVKRSTYLTPSLPAISVLAGFGLMIALAGFSRRGGAWGRTSLVVAAVLVSALAIVPSVRFGTALVEPDTRTLAKSWIEREIRPGTRVAVEEYGPVLNPSKRQLTSMVTADTTAVEEWKGPQRQLSKLRLDVGLGREPRYAVYGIGHGTEPFRLMDAYADPGALAAEIESLGIKLVVVSSKAAPWRAMEGAAPPPGGGDAPFYQWLTAAGRLRERFTARVPVPPIDRGHGRSFHSPVIEVYELEHDDAVDHSSEPEGA